jgi:hypothetical protein
MFNPIECREALITALAAADKLGVGRQAQVVRNTVEMRAYLSIHPNWRNISSSRGREVYKASSGVTVIKTGNGPWMIARDF